MADDSPSSARVIPKKKDFSWVGGGYQVTSPRGVAAIAAKRGGANPYGNPAGVAQAEWLQAPPVDNPNLVNPVAAPNPALGNGSIAPMDGPYESSNEPGVVRNADGSIDIPGSLSKRTGVNVGEVFSLGAGESLVNPNTGFPASPTPAERAEDERQRWLAEGGSDATLHRAQAASGMRPAIDARGNPTAANSNAAAEIRQGWGWGPSVTSGSQGTTVAAQMTKTFTDLNTRSGAQQAGWNQKFTDARARLRQSLES